tara:strand:+ start:5218 stop:5604 length:387 start_codon:yes stop_codon:yes gene_type:complete
MNIAPSGRIKQVIHPDILDPSKWQSGFTTTINTQILNSSAYRAVTGKNPPNEPISAETYKEHGYPFFKVYEEPSGVFGDFTKVKSIAEIDKRDETDVNPPVIHLGQGNVNGKCATSHFLDIRVIVTDM